MRGVDGFHLLH